MKLKIILPLIGILLIAIIITASIMQSNDDTEKITTAQCLTEKGFSMAGTSWCPHCNKQKELFGDAFQYIDYHDCELEEEWCTAHGIEGYPSWVSPTGATSPGLKSLSKLKQLSGC